MKLFTRLRYNFFAGVLITLPVFLTVLILKFLYEMLNNILLEPLTMVFRPFLGEFYFIILAKLTALLVTLALITLIGFMARWLLARQMFLYMEKHLLLKIPLLNKIYSSVKEISHAFLGEKSKLFRKVVLVEYPRKDVFSIGFIASETKGEVQEKTQKEVVNVFVPTVPNPTSGFLLLFPKDEIIPLDMSVEDGLKLVISGGAIVPQYRK